MLKRLFSVKNKFSVNIDSIIDSETNIYTEDYYYHRLSEERLRAERTNSTLSLITIEAQPSLKNGSGKSVVQLAKLLNHITRKTDIKSWYQNDKIAILMPETSKDGAIKMAVKLSKEIKKTINGKLSNGSKTTLKLYTYGNSSTDPSFVSLPLKVFQDETKDNAIQFAINSFTHEKFFSLSDSYSSTMLINPDNSLWIQLQKALKRSIDLVGSFIGIILSSPLLIIIAILIKLSSSGPILFKQVRNGFRGQKFIFLKFRTMQHNSTDTIHQNHVLNLIKESKNNDNVMWSKLSDDPRITTFGKFLRKTSLDELPQLFNVLFGQMSLVGPRPPIPYEVNEYQLWHWKRTLDVKPGITGLWQVEGRNDSTFTNMIRLDLAYIQNWSLWLDFKILLKTFLVVLSTKGAS